MTVYIENEKGGVHSVTDEHYNTYLTTTTNDGGTFPIPGITVLTEKEARARNPQLFGHPDPAITFTPAELVAQATYQKQLAEFREAAEANAAAVDAQSKE